MSDAAEATLHDAPGGWRSEVRVDGRPVGALHRYQDGSEGFWPDRRRFSPEELDAVAALLREANGEEA